jgi:hypothetical protein
MEGRKARKLSQHEEVSPPNSLIVFSPLQNRSNQN